MSYRFIGDSTGIPYHYTVGFKVYAVPDSALLNSLVVFITSSCYSDTTITLNRVRPIPSWSGSRIDPKINCGDTVKSNGFEVFSHWYQQSIVLPGKCSNYKFEYNGGYRDSNLTNLVNPSNSKFYFRAFLNNSMGPNTSARFISDPRSIFCENIPSFTQYAAIEPNQDSISFQLISALDSLGIPVNYTSGLSFLNPIPSNGPFSLSKINPSQVGLYTLVLEASEYRHDTTFGLYTQVGSTFTEFNVRIENSCSKSLFSSAFGGPKVLRVINGVRCGDSIISFKTDLFQDYSLSQDGSEFRLIDGNSAPRPIIEANTQGRPDLLSDSIWLKLHAPLLANDTLLLYLKTGSDNNTLISPCGNEFPAFDSAMVIVNDCGITDVIEKEKTHIMSIYPNPTRNRFILETSEYQPQRIILFDMQGKELKSIKPNSTSSEIDISGFSSGVYLLKVDVGGQQVVRLIEKI